MDRCKYCGVTLDMFGMVYCEFECSLLDKRDFSDIRSVVTPRRMELRANGVVVVQREFRDDGSIIVTNLANQIRGANAQWIYYDEEGNI